MLARLYLLLVFTLLFIARADAQDSSARKSDEGKQIPLPSQAPPNPLEGTLVEWEGWKFRWQFREIEGLILTDVHFQGRKLLKTIGLAEIYVPYAPGWPRPEDFALGGFKANPMPLEIGRDCTPGSTKCRAFLGSGVKATEKTADVMIHEEPLGLMYAGSQGRATGKMLVLWCMVHFPGPGDGYTYILRWKLQSDGTLMGEVGATGGLQHLGVGKETGLGVIVGKDKDGNEVFAPSHVHNFYFRIDFDIDGTENCFEEFSYNVRQDDSLTAAASWETVPKELGRFLNETTFRSWRAVNRKSLNAMGRPRSYHLIPGGKGSFRDNLPNQLLKADFIVTRFKPDEYPYTKSDQRRMLDAVSSYMNDEPAIDTDLVAWYRMSFAHHPRTEDWVAQPVVWHHFELVPRDFLDASPLKAEK